jgi:hypothetical protein
VPTFSAAAYEVLATVRAEEAALGAAAGAGLASGALFSSPAEPEGTGFVPCGLPPPAALLAPLLPEAGAALADAPAGRVALAGLVVALVYMLGVMFAVGVPAASLDLGIARFTSTWETDTGTLSHKDMSGK